MIDFHCFMKTSSPFVSSRLACFLSRESSIFLSESLNYQWVLGLRASL
jgi:hypothetical protein